MSTLPATLPALEDGDYNAEGVSIAPRDAIDDVLSDIVDGKSARAKLDRLKSGKAGALVRYEKPLAKRGVSSAFDEAAADLVAETRQARLPAREADADVLLDRAIEKILGPDELPERRSSERDQVSADANIDEAAADRRGWLVANAITLSASTRNALTAFAGRIQEIAREFPGIRSNADALALARADPAAYARFQARSQEVQATAISIDAALNEADAARRAAFNEVAATEDAKFERRNPLWDDHDSTEAMAMLQDAGVSMREMEELYSNPTPVNLGDPRALKLIEGAARYKSRKPLTDKASLWPAMVDMMNKAGFSDQELSEISRGGPVCMRDHRIQQVLAWALEWRRGGK